MRGTKSIVAAVGLLVLSPVYGDGILVNCSRQTSEVRCVAGYAEGGGVTNLPYEVISYDEALLDSGHTGQSSSFSFTPSTDAYYILLDAGPGHVVEVDVADVQ